jgi:hypothetical protein
VFVHPDFIYRLKGSIMFPSVIPARTATAGGGKSTATQLAEDINIIGICATAGDSVLAPTTGAAADVICNFSEANAMN